MSKKRCLGLVAAVVALPGAVHAQTPVGTAFTYQGQLKQGGVPVTGTCDFIFTLWDHPELADPAHNKGEAGAGGVQVSNGLFALKLDFGSGAFDGSARWLEANVCCPSGSCGEADWEMLSPRQELTPTPYAVYAASGAGVGGGFWSASGDDIHNTNVGNVGLGTSTPAGILDVLGPNGGDILLGVNDVGLRIIATDPAGNLNLKPRVDGAAIFARDGNTDKGIRLYGGGLNEIQSVDLDGTSPAWLGINPNGGNVGIGTGTPAARLDVAAGDIRLDANQEVFFEDNGQIRSHDDNHRILFRRDENTLELREWGNIVLSAGATAGEETASVVVNASGRVGIGTAEPAAKLTIGGTPGTDGIMFPDGTLQTTAATGGGGLTLPYSASVSSGATLFAVSNTGAGGAIYGEASGSGEAARGIWGQATGANTAGVFGQAMGFTGRGVHGVAENTGSTTNYGGLFEAKGETGHGVHAEATNFGDGPNYGGYFAAAGRNGGGVYGLALGTDGVGVSARSETGKAVDALTTSASTNEWTPAVYARNEGAGDGLYGWSQSRHGAVGVTYSDDPNHSAVWAKNNGAGSGILAEAGSGGYAGVFNGRIRANVVEITGGSDLSEQFDITAGQHAVAPGMLVCIDPNNPGNLVVSARAYDRTVAGIVSGAGGVAPGMLMGQTGSLANGEHPVALSGRVWAWCDVSNGPIQPGDLLTTSNTPGHAMKVGDYDKARGAIIGKAMSSLEEETGLVLVLVLPQ